MCQNLTKTIKQLILNITMHFTVERCHKKLMIKIMLTVNSVFKRHYQGHIPVIERVERFP